MIRKIGVVCQDANSFGFLQGIRRRLRCDAELVEPETGALGKSTQMNRTQAKLAAADLRNRGVDLIVRFTDADEGRWQEIRRHEHSVFPDYIGPLLVCGVAVENTEHWLALDREYLSQALGRKDIAIVPTDQLTGIIKSAIARARQSDEEVWNVTARIVADAPAEVFRAWLKADDSLRRFYKDCRDAALQHNCIVPNELEAENEGK